MIHKSAAVTMRKIVLLLAPVVLSLLVAVSYLQTKSLLHSRTMAEQFRRTDHLLITLNHPSANLPSAEQLEEILMSDEKASLVRERLASNNAKHSISDIYSLVSIEACSVRIPDHLLTSAVDDTVAFDIVFTCKSERDTFYCSDAVWHSLRNSSWKNTIEMHKYRYRKFGISRTEEVRGKASPGSDQVFGFQLKSTGAHETNEEDD